MSRNSTILLAATALVVLGLALAPDAGAGVLYLESWHSARAESGGYDRPSAIDAMWFDDPMVLVGSPSVAPASVFVDGSALRPAVFWSPDSVARSAAYQNAAGLNAVAAEYFLGDMYLVEGEGQARYHVTFTNDGTEPVRVVFDFFLTGGSLSLLDPSHLTSELHAEVGAAFQFGRDDPGLVPTHEWTWQAWLEGGLVTPDSWELEAEVEDNDFGVASPLVTVAADADAIRATIAPYTASLDLGVIDPGEQVWALYQIMADVRGPGYGTGAVASIGDPYSFLVDGVGAGGTFRIVSGPIAPSADVPEPSAIVLFSAALLALGRVRGRRGGRTGSDT